MEGRSLHWNNPKYSQNYVPMILALICDVHIYFYMDLRWVFVFGINKLINNNLNINILADKNTLRDVCDKVSNAIIKWPLDLLYLSW